jgi:hypothetical protein
MDDAATVGDRAGGRRGPDWASVLGGATAGLAVLVPVTIVRVVVDRSITDFDHSAWIYPLSVLVLVAYGLAGAVGARGATRAPRWTGAVAGLGTVLGWIPIRAVIWAIRDSGRALLVGTRPVLPPGQLAGALVLGLVVGWVGALLGTLGRRPPAGERPVESTPVGSRGA